MYIFTSFSWYVLTMWIFVKFMLKLNDLENETNSMFRVGLVFYKQFK